ncbi:hypothetical protein AGMMS50256_22340 [Betaproteobacteria bacterium]|nr:hypothetical protein AGMMS50256_22340 [Betaproteobacteria bacterium]
MDPNLSGERFLSESVRHERANASNFLKIPGILPLSFSIMAGTFLFGKRNACRSNGKE